MHVPVVARVAAVALALAVAAALAMQLYGEREIAEASKEHEKAYAEAARAGRLIAPDTADAILDRLRAARTLRPGTETHLNAAAVEVSAGRPERTLSLLRDAVRREPDNYEAVVAYALALQAMDPALARPLVARARELNPLSAQRVP